MVTACCWRAALASNWRWSCQCMLFPPFQTSQRTEALIDCPSMMMMSLACDSLRSVQSRSLLAAPKLRFAREADAVAPVHVIWFSTLMTAARGLGAASPLRTTLRPFRHQPSPRHPHSSIFTPFPPCTVIDHALRRYRNPYPTSFRPNSADRPACSNGLNLRDRRPPPLLTDAFTG